MVRKQPPMQNFESTEGGEDEVAFPRDGGRELLAQGLGDMPTMRFAHVEVQGHHLSAFQRVTLDGTTDAVLLFFVPLCPGHSYAVAVKNNSKRGAEQAGPLWPHSQAIVLKLPSTRIQPTSDEASDALRARLSKVSLTAVTKVFKDALSKQRGVFAGIECDVCGKGSLKSATFQCSRCPEGQFDMCVKCSTSATCNRVANQDHAVIK
jgi:hypothetical protein